jgi:hypothetical protein
LKSFIASMSPTIRGGRSRRRRRHGRGHGDGRRVRDRHGDVRRRDRLRLAQDECGATDLDLELREVAPLEQASQPVDQAEQRCVARVPGHDLGDRRGTVAGVGQIRAGLVLRRPVEVVGHPSHRLKINAVF